MRTRRIVTSLVLGAAAMLASGCSVFGGGGASAPFVEASRRHIDTTGPEYERYVANDPALDQTDKTLRILNVQTYSDAVAAEEARLGASRPRE